MKKLLYSVTALLTILVVGCTKFDEPYSENYAPAPEFSIDALATVADSSATFKIAIDKDNTTRFAVALLNDSVLDADYPEGLTLLKGNVDPKDRVCLLNADTLVLRSDTTVSYAFKNLMVQVTGNNVSYSYTGLQPNTSYTLVAVVSNKFGNVGTVKGLPVTTTDNLAPALSKVSRGESGGSLTLAFLENMQRGEGKVSVKYYAPYDFSITGTVPEKDVKCEFKGKEITVSCDSVPAGALMLVSWEAGAFKDMKGNNCNAVVTEINMETGRVANGCYFMVNTEPFSFSLADVLDYGEPFVDYATFTPSIGYSKPLFIQYDEDDEQAVIALAYTKDDVIVMVPAIWNVEDTAIVLSFKKEMDYGAKVSFAIPAGAVVDAFGNPNEEFLVDEAWIRSYGLTDKDILGLYDVQYYSAAYGEVEETSMLITRSGNGGLKVSGLFYDDACLDAFFDGDLGILYIEDFQYMTSLGAYRLYFATGREDGYAQLQYNPDSKSFSSEEEAEIGIYYQNTGNGKYGWMDYSLGVEATYAEDQTLEYPQDLMVGSYRFIFHDATSKDPESVDTLTCTIEAGEENTLIIRDLVFEGSEVTASFDPATGKLVIPDWQYLGLYSGAYECFLSTYDLQVITFYCSPDGTAVTDATESSKGYVMGVMATSGGQSVGWLYLADGDVILEPYDPEEESAGEAAPMRGDSAEGALKELYRENLPQGK